MNQPFTIRATGTDATLIVGDQHILGTLNTRIETFDRNFVTDFTFTPKEFHQEPTTTEPEQPVCADCEMVDVPEPGMICERCKED